MALVLSHKEEVIPVSGISWWGLVLSRRQEASPPAAGDAEGRVFRWCALSPRVL